MSHGFLRIEIQNMNIIIVKFCHMGHTDILKVLIVLCDLSMSGHRPGTHKHALCLPFEIFAPRGL